MKHLVVDASVACKWFFNEDLSPEARVLAKSEAAFSAPDIILTECANAVWQRVVSKTVSRAHAQAFLTALPQWFELLTPSTQLYDLAFEMACDLEHPVYDCQYLALAENRKIRLVTADRIFADRVRRSRWQDRVKSLGGD